ncbi:hypothetical protein VNO77_12316 [Canavalia gladiata]|uniref:BHLH domain-containing protein n=1 Tax=Canavalia gladiata TaxID=3824 RepID=A0AAN9M1B0_CANGL
MEPAQLISDEWGSLSGHHTAEEADFMAQFLGGNYSVTEKHYTNTTFDMPSTFWPCHESTTLTMTGTDSNSHFPSNVANTNFLCFSRGSCSITDSGNNIFSTTSTGNYTFSPHCFQWSYNLSQQINESTDDESSLDPAHSNLQTKRECEMMISETVEEDGNRNLESPDKRFRSSIEVSETLRNPKSRRNPMSASMSNEDDGSLSLQRHGSSTQGDSNASLEPSGEVPKDLTALNLYRKSRATSSAATDAQSLYARKRRERINERLRILQKLVPNGTKVDISTMLEEAVQYVKFLQLQIKLLSSDDLWMYAPIAYNGINIGLDLSVSPTKGR